MKHLILTLVAAGIVGSTYGQSDPSFRLKPAGDLGTCNIKKQDGSKGTSTTPLCPNGRCIATRSYSQMAPYLNELKESLGAIERIPNHKDFVQLERAAVQLRDIIWRTEHQLATSASSSGAEQQLALQSPSGVGKPQALRDSSQQPPHGPLLPKPVAFQGQGLTVILARQ